MRKSGMEHWTIICCLSCVKVVSSFHLPSSFSAMAPAAQHPSIVASLVPFVPHVRHCISFPTFPSLFSQHGRQRQGDPCCPRRHCQARHSERRGDSVGWRRTRCGTNAARSVCFSRRNERSPCDLILCHRSSHGAGRPPALHPGSHTAAALF